MKKLRRALGMWGLAAAAGLAAGGGCGENATLLNPAFVNFAVGGVVPLAPRAGSEFVLVRVVNNTATNIRFVVSAERAVDRVDETGAIITEIQKETRRLQTSAESLSNEAGVLLDCPVVRVGLGENLDFPATEPGLFIGADVGGAEGFGVPGNVNPLDATAGNFTCGDTLIFQANITAGTIGNLTVQTFILRGVDQRPEVAIDTFTNARNAINQLTVEEP